MPFETPNFVPSVAPTTIVEFIQIFIIRIIQKFIENIKIFFKLVNSNLMDISLLRLYSIIDLKFK